MGELVNIINNQVVTDSRKVAEVFGKEHKNVIQSIENITAENSAVTSMFYETDYTAGTGKHYKMYLMNRDGFSLLVMGFTGAKALEWKIKYIAAFNAMEKELQAQGPSYQIADPIERAKAWIKEQEQLKQLAAQNEEMKPKALFADAVSSSHTSILIRDLAKIIKQNGVDIGQNRLFSWLRENGYLIKSGSDKNMPTQKAMDMKLFEVKEGSRIDSSGRNCITRTTKVTGKGQLYFVKKWLMKE